MCVLSPPNLLCAVDARGIIHIGASMHNTQAMVQQSATLGENVHEVDKTLRYHD